MSSPFLDIAIGALRGAKGNRQATQEAEDRRRRQAREDLALKLQLAEFAGNPDFEVMRGGAQVPGAMPHLDAAIGPPEGMGAAPGPSVGGPVAEASIGGPGGAPAAAPPAVTGGPGAGAGAATPAIAPGRPAPGPPTTTPFLDQALELGDVDVGGEQFSVRAHPGRKRAQAEKTNRAAYEALHQADAEAYPAFIEGMPEGYYAEELSDYAQGVRAGRIEDKRARREGRTAQVRQAQEARRDAARDAVFSLAQDGKSFEEVAAAMAEDRELRGVLTRSEIRREMQSAGQINAPAREKAQRMAVLKTQLGKPPRPSGNAAPIDAELQQDILEALGDGSSAEEVLDALGGDPAAPTVRTWLRRGRQLAR